MDDIELWMERKGFREEAHFAFSYTPVRSERGDIEGFFCVCQETTGQVTAERRLRESEARAQADAERVKLTLAAGAIIGTWFWDLPSDRFTVDEQFARAFGIDPGLGRSGLSLEQVIATVHPEDKPGLIAAIEEAIARGGPYLPRLISDVQSEEEVIASNIERSRAQETILVVEDDDDVRAYSAECLRELGYQVLEAHDGPSALRVLDREEQCIDLLFTDVVMPEMTGRELADQAREKRPDLKVLYTSGYTRNAIVHGGRLTVARR